MNLPVPGSLHISEKFAHSNQECCKKKNCCKKFKKKGTHCKKCPKL